jgi:hypothetical protein
VKRDRNEHDYGEQARAPRVLQRVREQEAERAAERAAMSELQRL